jgi:hypothetical protein
LSGRKTVYRKRYRGFESHLLRKIMSLRIYFARV